MIIPSIDLRDGKAVQLRQGRDHVLTSERDPLELAATFSRYGPVAIIDLDAALGQGDNLPLISRMCRVAEARVGGGIRDAKRARALLSAGAQKLIIGTAAEPELLAQFAPDQLLVALDHEGGVVLDQGWTRSTGELLAERAARLAPLCSGFLCTFVEHEGGMGGMPLTEVQALQETLSKPLTVAGGVASTAEAVALCRMGLDVQVGMALYTDALDLADVVAGSLDFDKLELLPTVVQDTAGQVRMLAYSSPESLRRALREGKGIYYSRSRKELWEKGASSGNTQKLLRCRADCDRDALLFTVEQTGPSCHNGSHSCFGPARFSMPALFALLRQRKEQLPEGSFTAKLLEDKELLLRKLNEEAFEVTRAATDDELRWEAADLVYFLSVLAVGEGLDWSDVEAELRARRGGG